MNARSIAGMEEHPDIMELRARYELAAAAPLAQFADGLIFLTGLYLAISPWVVGFNASMRSLAVNDLITGVALALIGAGLASAYGRTHGMAWVAPIVGIWTIITPWVIRGGSRRRPRQGRSRTTWPPGLSSWPPAWRQCRSRCCPGADVTPPAGTGRAARSAPVRGGGPTRRCDMRFPYRRQWLLRRMNRSLSRSDPHLAAMLAIFARLTAGEAITSKEQSTSPGARAWRGLAWLGRGGSTRGRRPFRLRGQGTPPRRGRVCGGATPGRRSGQGRAGRLAPGGSALAAKRSQTARELTRRGAGAFQGK